MEFPGADADMLKQPFHGCKAAVFIGERLLTILRDDKPDIPYPNMWDLPGGGREADESPLDTVRREIMEELGLDVPEDAFTWARLYPAHYEPDAKVWFFVAGMPIGTERNVVFGNEGQRWALIDPDEFIALDNVIPSYAGRLADWRAET